MDNIKQKNTIVSRETKVYYMMSGNEIHRINCDTNGTVILELTNPPVCHNYSCFESTCISECTWCDDPFHCKYKIVSRETYYTAHDLAIIIIATDFCWNNFECCSYCDDDCIHNVSSDMTAIALTMLQGGEY